MKTLIFQINDGDQNVALAERAAIFSGAITPNSPASTGSPNHGVIFTFNKKFGSTVIVPDGNTPLDISELTPEILLETVIENTDLPASEKDRFFHIIGGYFISFSGNAPNRTVTTSQVFGVAKESRFGIKEGGTTILVDNWKMLDPERGLDDMDERKKGPDEEIGWTLIVEEAKMPRSKYPLSGKPIRMTQECADIVNLESEQIADTDTTVSFRFTATIDGPEPKEFTWNFGAPGSSPLTNGNVVEHTYTKATEAAAHKVSVSSVGVGKCGSFAEIDINIPPVPPKPCPVVTQVDALRGDLTDNGLKYTFTVQMSGGMATSFDWDFGDGNTKNTKNPKATHTYARPVDADAKFLVKVNTSGPDDCTGAGETKVEVPVKCPVLGAINENLIVRADTKTTFEFEVVFTGVKPSTFHWDFGDGTSADIPRTRVEHTYDRPIGTKQKRTIAVSSEGPTDDCSGTSSIEIELLPQCPQISPNLLSVSPDPVPNSETHTINFVTQFTGPKPDFFNWDFGDGTTEQTTTAETSHEYQRPGDLQSGRFEVRVETSGPDDCKGFATGEVDIPEACPLISGIIHTLTSSSETELVFDFSVPLTSGSQPETYTWDFGDGSPTEQTTVPNVSHTYPNPEDGHFVTRVRVKTQGPNTCFGEAELNIDFQGDCFQTIDLAFEALESAQNSPTQSFVFKVNVLSGPNPEFYDWDFGDGTTQRTNTPQVEHAFNKHAQDIKTFLVQVHATGPKNCASNAEIEIPVGPLCPELTSVVGQISALTDTETHFDFQLSFVGNVPTEFNWNFGDGQTAKTSIPEASHTYARPIDEDNTFMVNVQTSGPDNCSGNAETDVLIPVQCPQIPSIITVAGTVSGEQQEFTFTAQVIGKTPNVFHWDFGDGNNANTDGPTVKHTYTLPEAVEQKFTIILTTEGPSTCVGRAETEIIVKPPCPVILDIEHIAAVPAGELHTYEFTAHLKGPVPDSMLWDFGDGTTSSLGTSVSHSYDRPQGADISHEVTVTISGPENCRDERKVNIPITGICPEIIEIRKKPIELTDTQFEVEFTAVVKGAAPDSFVWDFGDGSGTQTTTGNSLIHIYERPDGQSETFTVSVNSSGPANCQSSISVDCKVPGECPVVVDLQKTKEILTETSVSLVLTAIISPAGTTPDLFVWNLGDGQGDIETIVPTINATYTRTDQDQNIRITLRTEGPVPGNDLDPCKSDIEIICPVPKVECPVVVGIDAKKGVATETHQPYSFTADVRSSKEPALYKWNFGDGSPIVETKKKTTTHDYKRTAGIKAEYSVNLDTEGPANCGASVTTKVDVDGICPQIVKVEIKEELTADSLKVTLTPTVMGPNPDGYQVEWGDGKIRPQVMLQAPLVNVYERKPGEAISYKIKVDAFGPGQCQSYWEGKVEVPPLCPTILKVKQTVVKETEFVLGVRFDISWEGPRPELFILSFGKVTTPVLSKEPVIFQNFNRFPGRNYSVKGRVTLQGPKTCNTDVDIEVEVPGICPELKELAYVLNSSTKDSQTYRFTVKAEGFPPEKYHWDFGDGKGIQESRSASINYTYDRPKGTSKTYQVTVTGVGPKECQSEKYTEVLIPPRCPELSGITAKVQPPTETELEVTFTAVTETPAPDSFSWDFGDGTPVETSDSPSITHRFQRPVGKDVVFIIKVNSSGPGDCYGEAELSCPIPGRCPEITGIQTKMDPPLPKVQKAYFTATYKDLKPSQFVWNFGDGTGSQTTDTPHTEHSYKRPVGEAGKYKVNVQGKGPDNCGSAGEVIVNIAEICPEITGISTKVKPPTETQLEVSFTALVNDPKPEEFIWNFGDGTPEKKTSSPSITHVYQRPEGDAETYTVLVRGKGPKSCESSAEIACPIPGVCPVMSEMDVQTELLPDTYKVILSPTISGPAPDGYTVDWGDGKFQTQTLVQAPFTNIYDRAVGEDVKRTIKVKAFGPDSCDSEWEGEVEVPGKCPELTNVKQEVVKQTDFVHGVKFTIAYSGPKPETFILSFGMITTPVISKSPEIFQNFNRFGGIDQTIKGTVIIQGPKGCNGEKEVEVFIPGSCPRITNLKKEITNSTRELHTLNFTAIHEGYPPEKYLWDFGDGTAPVESQAHVKSYAHGYTRFAGEDKKYIVKVTAIGPKDCRTEQKTEVEIPGICPAINKLQKIDEVLTETYKRVSYELSYKDIQAESYEWDWGDGTKKDTTKVPRASHDYVIKPGDTRSYTLQVQAKGPGNCASVDTDPVEVPGVCPVILKLIPSLESQSGNKQMVKVSLQTEGPLADSYTWTWGDGSPATTTQKPEAIHEYAILPGDDKIYSILVQAKGPDNCQSSCGGQVEIPGVCPVLSSLSVEYASPTETQQEITVTASIDGPMPDTFNWNWGDGSQETTHVASAKHTYERLPGDDKTYLVELELSGPENCGCESGVEVSIPGICPEITEVLITKDEPTDTELVVHAEAKIKGPSPKVYAWDWGDGNTEETKANKASHAYERPIGDPKEYEISVEASGPECCSSQGGAQVEIEGICPKIDCANLSYLEQTVATQKVKVALDMEGPDAETFSWDWGDGSAIQTTKVPEAEHAYKRPNGEDKSFTIKVEANGPCGCGSEIEVVADILGICPVITDFQVAKIAEEGDYEEVQVSYSISDPQPDRIEINWGDGTGIELVDGSPNTHKYLRKIGEDAQYKIEVAFVGPGTCSFACDYLVKVKAKCPKITGIEAQLMPSGEEQQLVKASVSVEDGNPDTYSWDWGDGSEITVTKLAEAEHRYVRVYGDDKSYSIQVAVDGPETCGCNAGTPVIIPGRCPKLIYKKTVFGDWDPECQVVNLVFDLIGEAPTSYTWDWGDGETSTSQEPKASHTYRRPSKDTDYKVTVVANGPGCCEIEQCVVIQVLGFCPQITRITTNYCGEGESFQEIKFTAQYRGKKPDQFEWNFGDGSAPEFTKGNSHKHTYKQGKGEALEYTVNIIAYGSLQVEKGEHCEEVTCTDESSINVQIPGSCPAIIGMNAILEDSDKNSQWVKWVLITRGPKPDSYEWNWGDGSAAETTAEPYARHLFAKDADAGKSYAIKVKAKGPKSQKGGITCVTQFDAKLEIKGDEVVTDC